jgi:hypothetical protein
MSSLPSDAEVLRRAVAQLVGQECWSATVAGGSLLLLKVGPRVPRAKPLLNLFLTELERTHDAELGVHIGCAWRLDGAGEVLSVWSDPKPAQCPTPPDLECLRGARITDAVLSGPAWDLTLHFGEVGCLRIFCDGSVLEPEEDDYSVFTPQGTVSVAAGGQVSFESA